MKSKQIIIYIIRKPHMKLGQCLSFAVSIIRNNFDLISKSLSKAYCLLQIYELRTVTKQSFHRLAMCPF